MLLNTWNRKTFSLQEDNDYIVNYKTNKAPEKKSGP